jgi:hypothetical protein
MLTIGGMMTEAYFKRTGYKFVGTDTEFQAVVPICYGKSCPIADEEGFFSKWYCIVDWKVCDKQCKNHKKPRKLNPDIKEFFEATCERYRKND